MKHQIKMMVRGLAVALLLSSIMALTPAYASIYYVTIAGNDNNQGSQSSPWRTIQKAADTMIAGDTVEVLAGDYNERILTKSNGTSGNYITFKANGSVNIKGFYINNHNYIKIDGFRITGEIEAYQGFIHLAGGSNCYLANNYIYYNGASSIYGIYMGRHSSSYCNITGNTLEGLKYPNMNIMGSYHLIEGNIIRNSPHDAMRIFGHDHVIKGNLFENLYDSGISHVDLFQTFGENGDPSFNVLIENNIARNCSGTQIGNFETHGRSDIRDWTFRNNVFENIEGQANIFAPGFSWYNNTFYHADQTTGGPLLFRTSVDRGVANNGVVKNNLFIDCGSRPLNTGWYNVEAGVNGFEADYNYVAGPAINGFPAKEGFSETHGINGGNPKFINIMTGNFKFQAGSPAINKGTTINSFNYDNNRVPRPQGPAWDIGAYEYNESSMSAPSNFRKIGP